MDDTFVFLQIYAALESVTFHHSILIKHAILTYCRNLYGCLLLILVKNIIRTADVSCLNSLYFLASFMLLQCDIRYRVLPQVNTSRIRLSWVRLVSSRWSCHCIWLLFASNSRWIQNKSIVQIYLLAWTWSRNKKRFLLFHSSVMEVWTWTPNPHTPVTQIFAFWSYTTKVLLITIHTTCRMEKHFTLAMETCCCWQS